MQTSASLDTLLLRPIVFTRPVRIVPPLSWVTHIPFAYWLVDALRPATIVELGTQSGNSYAALAQAVKTLRFNTACYAVDTWEGNHQTGLYGPDVYDEWSRFHSAHFSAFSRLIRAPFDNARGQFADRSIDLLHIDGLHTYEAVRHDFRTWLPKLSQRGVVLLHDINVREKDFGVWRLWAELERSYSTFSFLHGNGLGVVAIGPDLPPELRWLTSDLPRHPEQAALVRQFFLALGAGVDMQARLDPAAPHIAASSQGSDQPSESSSAVAKLEQEVQVLAAEVDQLSAWIARKDRALVGERERADEIESAWTGLRETLDQLEHENAVTDRTQASLRAELHAARHAHDRAARALRKATSELDRFHRRRRWTAPLRNAMRAGAGLGALLDIRHPRGLVTLARMLRSPQRLLELRSVAISGVFDARYYIERYPDVRAGRVSPLVHFVLSGAREGRSPHPLFDAGYYLSENPDVRATGSNPLVHYLRSGAGEGRDPHPLVRTSYYLQQRPDLKRPGVNPLVHLITTSEIEGTPHPLFDPQYYVDAHPEVLQSGLSPLAHFIDRGALAGYDPHPLFDCAYYLRCYPDVRAAGENPLEHYLAHVPGEDRDPHPLFDSTYYLSTAPDLLRAGVNPLAHFVDHGWREGRRPNPYFDPLWYLATNPDVEAEGWNPLAHFVRRGWRERRDPSPEFSTSGYLDANPDIVAADVNPLEHYLCAGAAEGRERRPSQSRQQLPASPRVVLRVHGTARDDGHSSADTVVFVSHVVPWPPRAGNEYRSLRLLQWLVARGYRVLLLLAPLPGQAVSDDQMQELERIVGNVAVCGRNGEIRYRLTSCPDVFADLDGRRTRRYEYLLGERAYGTKRERELLEIDRTFCHDTLLEAALHAVDQLDRPVLLAQYVWMQRLLTLAHGVVPTLLDTIDAYCTKAEKVLSYGIDDGMLTEREEAARLATADVVLAIQDDDRAVLQELKPGGPVVTVGVDFDLQPLPAATDSRIVLLIASGNPMNRNGLADFLRFAWPSVLTRVPDARLIVAGDVSHELPHDTPAAEAWGPVDDVRPLYARACVVINPAAAGTGLKIKTVEALALGRPIVTWPGGFDGIPEDIRSAMPPVGDWLEFADAVVHHLESATTGLDDRTAQAVRAFVSPERAYAALAEQLARLFAAVPGAASPTPLRAK